MEKTNSVLLGLFHVVSFYFDFTHGRTGLPSEKEVEEKGKIESDMEIEITYSCN